MGELFDWVLENWKKHHVPFPFSDATDRELDGAIAKVNLKTKELSIDVIASMSMAYRLGIRVELFMYYAISHELGHVLYQQTDKTSEEEHFAHDYACQDCHIHLSSFFTEEEFDVLDSIREKII